MALSRTYGKLDIPMIAENEPVFILRGQDSLAESAIQMYRLLAEAHGCRVAEPLAEEIGNFKQWSGERRLPSWPAVGRKEGSHRMTLVSRRR